MKIHKKFYTDWKMNISTQIIPMCWAHSGCGEFKSSIDMFVNDY